MYDTPGLEPEYVKLNWEVAMTVADLAGKLKDLPQEAKVIISIRPYKQPFINKRPTRVVLDDHTIHGYQTVYITD